MTDLLIDIDLYLSEDEKRDIARQSFANACAQRSREDFERIISNAAYDVVWKAVDESFGGEAVTALKAKVIEVISGLTSFSVFREPDNYGRKKSVGQEQLDAAMVEVYPALKEKALSVVNEFGEERMFDLIGTRFVWAVMEKLKA